MNSLSVVSRLDMPTSGLVVIPRTVAMAKKVRDQLSARRVAKKYYARVLGRFPAYAPPLPCESISKSPSNYSVQECAVPLQYVDKAGATQPAVRSLTSGYVI
jgi:23S rRNA-/tRNA-specific pseudouridylate synthase